MKIAFLMLILCFVSCINGDSNSSSGDNSDDGVSTIPRVSGDCRINTICATGGSADSATARVAFIKDTCADFSSSSTISAIGETTSVNCDSDNCTFTVNSWTANSNNITTLEDGTYNVVLYIDTDANGNPNSGDPYRCADGHSIGSSSTSIDETINSIL
ncbi:MAG: hypothetical protein CME65_12590 [Halobacteriovoraceae bacterium]|nr:hypothetical protein [Halobacteriovoraceae bacterium]|tara:strand:+ start:2560 stop:3036 length:477 start_codon:yes stop_codon:yes gene_type:complete